MALSDTARVLVADRSAIGTARTATRSLATTAGLDDHRTSEALIVASELATNLVSHAGGGSFAVRAAPGSLTLLAWDGGPGIPDVPRAFDDGFSTAGTAGTGLGAVRRLADRVEVRSSREDGTIVAARLGPAPGAGPEHFRVDGLTVPLGGAGPCGDAWAAREDGDALLVLLADGLGHGPHAAEAALSAVACLERGEHGEPGALLEAVHEELHRTRGAAVAIARIEPGLGQVRFAGVGNVTGLVLGGGARRTMLNHNGIVGRDVRRMQEVVYPLAPGSSIVLHTDGVRDGWDPVDHPGILREDPLLVAACVVRDGERGRDDTGVLVVHVGGPA